MSYFRLMLLIFTLIFSSSVFAITQKQDCYENQMPLVNVDKAVIGASSSFMDILKEMGWEQKSPDMEVANLDLIKFCNNYYNILADRAPKNWKNDKLVTGYSAQKIANSLALCLNLNIK